MDLSPYKSAIMAALPPVSAEPMPLDEPPPHTQELAECPKCGCMECEVWVNPPQRIAECPKCRDRFVPILEGAKRIVTLVMERRRKHRVWTSQQAKEEALRLLGNATKRSRR